MTGRQIYPHRSDLFDVWQQPFWRCTTEGCKCFVGCHHRHQAEYMRTEPLGCMPTKELRNARQHIHRLLDPMWQSKGPGRQSRTSVYRHLANTLGIREYHTAEIKTLDEARNVYRALLKIKHEGIPET